MFFDKSLPYVPDEDDNLVIDSNVPLSTGTSTLFRTDVGSKTSGVYLIKRQLQCFSQSHLNRKPPIVWTQALEMINRQPFPLI